MTISKHTYTTGTAPDASLLLLSRDLRLGGPDLQAEGHELAVDAVEEQLTLPGMEPTPSARPRRGASQACNQPSSLVQDDPLLVAFLRRLEAQGGARTGVRAYRWQMHQMLRIAAKLVGHSVTCVDLFRNEQLLGRALVEDTALTLGTQLSKWTLAQRRSAIRKFTTLMRPELLQVLGEDPNDVLDRALRGVADRVGGGYRLTGGAPRQRGGRAPSGTQIQDILDAVGAAPGYLGTRNRAFFTILAETGCRVNALRMLDGADCVEMPSGRLRLFLYEKGKREAREVELSVHAAGLLHGYIKEFNLFAALRRWPGRVVLGEPGAVWRNSWRGHWSEGDLRVTLRDGCAKAQVLEITPHAFRRAFATDAASVLSRHTVAQAGGWQGVRRLDDHYTQARDETIHQKLSRADRQAVESKLDEAAFPA